MDFLITLQNTISKLETRLDWDYYFMGVSLLISSRSPSSRLKVGAVIVKKDRVISVGYNGFFRGVPHNSIVRDDHEQNTVHAEQNCIIQAHTNLKDTTIYITHYPLYKLC